MAKNKDAKVWAFNRALEIVKLRASAPISVNLPKLLKDMYKAFLELHEEVSSGGKGS